MFSTTTITLLVILSICELIILNTFLFQRTVRKLGTRLGLSILQRNIFYSTTMLLMYRMSVLRWPILIVLFCVDLKCALIGIGIMCAFFALSIFLPVRDRANLLRIRKIITRRRPTIHPEIYEAIMFEISLEIEQTGGLPCSANESVLPEVEKPEIVIEETAISDFQESLFGDKERKATTPLETTKHKEPPSLFDTIIFKETPKNKFVQGELFDDVPLPQDDVENFSNRP